MKQVILYTGNGVSLSPVFAEGRTKSKYIRLVAEEEKAITNGVVTTICVDVLETDIDKWTDCALPEEEEVEATEADYLAALAKLGVE
jgi:hypothetical protein